MDVDKDAASAKAQARAARMKLISSMYPSEVTGQQPPVAPPVSNPKNMAYGCVDNPDGNGRKEGSF